MTARNSLNSTMEDTSVCSKSVRVAMENGLHLVPCSQIAQVASQFPCEIRLVKGNQRVDAKTIYAIMSLGAEFGTTLTVEATGESAEQAVAELVRLFESNFAA